MDKNLLIIELPWELSPRNLKEISCLICGGKGQKVGSVIVNKALLGIHKCSNDELMWLTPRPDQSFYDQMYGKFFYTSTCPEQYGYASVEEESRRKEKAVLNWKDIECESPVTLNMGSFLEIGCATGEMLGEAISRGWRSVWGNELSGAAVQKCREKDYNMYEGSCLEIEVKTPFDLIFADNVIEHLTDCREFLYKMEKLLSPDGMLCLRLPNTPPTGPELKLIDHTYHFNPRSLGLLLNTCGLTIAKVIDSGIFHGSEGKRIKNMTLFCLRSE